MLFGPKHTFQDGNQWSYQIWPVQFVYGRTGHFEEFSIANTGSPLKKFNFQCTYFPGLYSYAVWTKTHLSRWESMVIPDLTCTVRVRPHRGLWSMILYSYGTAPLKKFNFQCTYFPGLYSYAVWTKTHLSRWESMRHTRFDLYSSLYGRTGFEVILYSYRTIEKNLIDIPFLLLS